VNALGVIAEAIRLLEEVGVDSWHDLSDDDPRKRELAARFEQLRASGSRKQKRSRRRRSA
jgi:hypothetical protein